MDSASGMGPPSPQAGDEKGKQGDTPAPALSSNRGTSPRPPLLQVEMKRTSQALLQGGSLQDSSYSNDQEAYTKNPCVSTAFVENGLSPSLEEGGQEDQISGSSSEKEGDGPAKPLTMQVYSDSQKQITSGKFRAAEWRFSAAFTSQLLSWMGFQGIAETAEAQKQILERLEKMLGVNEELRGVLRSFGVWNDGTKEGFPSVSEGNTQGLQVQTRGYCAAVSLTTAVSSVLKSLRMPPFSLERGLSLVHCLWKGAVFNLGSSSSSTFPLCQTLTMSPRLAGERLLKASGYSPPWTLSARPPAAASSTMWPPPGTTRAQCTETTVEEILEEKGTEDLQLGSLGQGGHENRRKIEKVGEDEFVSQDGFVRGDVVNVAPPAFLSAIASVPNSGRGVNESGEKVMEYEGEQKWGNGGALQKRDLQGGICLISFSAGRRGGTSRAHVKEETEVAAVGDGDGDRGWDGKTGAPGETCVFDGQKAEKEEGEKGCDETSAVPSSGERCPSESEADSGCLSGDVSEKVGAKKLGGCGGVVMQDCVFERGEEGEGDRVCVVNEKEGGEKEEGDPDGSASETESQVWLAEGVCYGDLPSSLSSLLRSPPNEPPAELDTLAEESEEKDRKMETEEGSVHSLPILSGEDEDTGTAADQAAMGEGDEGSGSSSGREENRDREREGLPLPSFSVSSFGDGQKQQETPSSAFVAPFAALTRHSLLLRKQTNTDSNRGQTTDEPQQHAPKSVSSLAPPFPTPTLNSLQQHEQQQQQQQSRPDSHRRRIRDRRGDTEKPVKKSLNHGKRGGTRALSFREAQTHLPHYAAQHHGQGYLPPPPPPRLPPPRPLAPYCYPGLPLMRGFSQSVFLPQTLPFPVQSRQSSASPGQPSQAQLHPLSVAERQPSHPQSRLPSASGGLRTWVAEIRPGSQHAGLCSSVPHHCEDQGGNVRKKKEEQEFISASSFVNASMDSRNCFDLRMTMVCAPAAAAAVPSTGTSAEQLQKKECEGATVVEDVETKKEGMERRADENLSIPPFAQKDLTNTQTEKGGLLIPNGTGRNDVHPSRRLLRRSLIFLKESSRTTHKKGKEGEQEVEEGKGLERENPVKIESSGSLLQVEPLAREVDPPPPEIPPCAAREIYLPPHKRRSISANLALPRACESRTASRPQPYQLSVSERKPPLPMSRPPPLPRAAITSVLENESDKEAGEREESEEKEGVGCGEEQRGEREKESDGEFSSLSESQSPTTPNVHSRVVPFPVITRHTFAAMPKRKVGPVQMETDGGREKKKCGTPRQKGFEKRSIHPSHPPPSPPRSRPLPQSLDPAPLTVSVWRVRQKPDEGPGRATVTGPNDCAPVDRIVSAPGRAVERDVRALGGQGDAPVASPVPLPDNWKDLGGRREAIERGASRDEGHEDIFPASFESAWEGEVRGREEAVQSGGARCDGKAKMRWADIVEGEEEVSERDLVIPANCSSSSSASQNQGQSGVPSRVCRFDPFEDCAFPMKGQSASQESKRDPSTEGVERKGGREVDCRVRGPEQGEAAGGGRKREQKEGQNGSADREGATACQGQIIVSRSPPAQPVSLCVADKPEPPQQSGSPALPAEEESSHAPRRPFPIPFTRNRAQLGRPDEPDYRAIAKSRAVQPTQLLTCSPVFYLPPECTDQNPPTGSSNLPPPLPLGDRRLGVQQNAALQGDHAAAKWFGVPSSNPEETCSERSSEAQCLGCSVERPRPLPLPEPGQPRLMVRRRQFLESVRGSPSGESEEADGEGCGLRVKTGREWLWRHPGEGPSGEDGRSAAVLTETEAGKVCVLVEKMVVIETESASAVSSVGSPIAKSAPGVLSVIPVQHDLKVEAGLVSGSRTQMNVEEEEQVEMGEGNGLLESSAVGKGEEGEEGRLGIRSSTVIVGEGGVDVEKVAVGVSSAWTEVKVREGQRIEEEVGGAKQREEEEGEEMLPSCSPRDIRRQAQGFAEGCLAGRGTEDDDGVTFTTPKPEAHSSPRMVPEEPFEPVLRIGDLGAFPSTPSYWGSPPLVTQQDKPQRETLGPLDCHAAFKVLPPSILVQNQAHPSGRQQEMPPQEQGARASSASVPVSPFGVTSQLRATAPVFVPGPSPFPSPAHSTHSHTLTLTDPSTITTQALTSPSAATKLASGGSQAGVPALSAADLERTLLSLLSMPGQFSQVQEGNQQQRVPAVPQQSQQGIPVLSDWIPRLFGSMLDLIRVKDEKIDRLEKEKQDLLSLVQTGGRGVSS
uniref:Uncharacterized protein n=1 Tax=Chromera velia CCMP2878 TaxID=1169474 RepID=A0A0G4HY16_9ALVE|eukprot:Cvel_1513.t1-p1 / transcript=Cvel_1513.t1 / gene=Cvel_1513 / organism=Chromera_velia_CCMP2878 / gene_product=hypothetical protein / transcript_product=hypothetical protein / location=Cvel_scaffold53:84448-93512(-) / protein_length=2228 / sequence_SO=supercontig / SO=protein_coding / is_pseudo=false